MKIKQIIGEDTTRPPKGSERYCDNTPSKKDREIEDPAYWADQEVDKVIPAKIGRNGKPRGPVTFYKSKVNEETNKEEMIRLKRLLRQATGQKKTDRVEYLRKEIKKLEGEMQIRARDKVTEGPSIKQMMRKHGVNTTSKGKPVHPSAKEFSAKEIGNPYPKKDSRHADYNNKWYDRQLVGESDGGTCAGAIASGPAVPLFTKPIKRTNKKIKENSPVSKKDPDFKDELTPDNDPVTSRQFPAPNKQPVPLFTKPIKRVKKVKENCPAEINEASMQRKQLARKELARREEEKIKKAEQEREEDVQRTAAAFNAKKKAVKEGVLLNFEIKNMLEENQLFQYLQQKDRTLREVGSNLLRRPGRFSDYKHLHENKEYNTIKQYMSKLSDIGLKSNKKISIGDKLAVLYFDVIFGFKEIIMHGFSTPKQIKNIVMNKNSTIQIVQFVDGDQFPRAPLAQFNGRPLDYSVFFTSKELADQATTMAALSSPAGWEFIVDNTFDQALNVKPTNENEDINYRPPGGRVKFNPPSAQGEIKPSKLQTQSDKIKIAVGDVVLATQPDTQAEHPFKITRIGEKGYTGINLHTKQEEWYAPDDIRANDTSAGAKIKKLKEGPINYDAFAKAQATLNKKRMQQDKLQHALNSKLNRPIVKRQGNTEDVAKVARQLEQVVSNCIPDCDPSDHMIPWIKRTLNATDDQVFKYLDKAGRQLGYKDYYDYLAGMWDMYNEINTDAQTDNPWR